MSTRTFAIGLLGTGIMGRRMLATLQRHARFQVASAWDASPQALTAALASAPGVSAARSAEHLINDPALDVIYIATPPAHHAAAVRAVLAAGRGCLCEKPLTHDIAQARSLREAVVASGLPFAVNFPFARGSASTRLVELVRGGDLGRVRSASVTLRFARWPRDWQTGASSWLAGPAEGGFTREVLSHFVFLAQRLFGPATVADVALTRPQWHAETALRARLDHATGTALTIDAAVSGDVADDNRFEVVGDHGRAALTGWSRLEYQGQTSARVDDSLATLDGLAALLEGRSDHGLATIDEAADVVGCIETLLAAEA